MTYSFEEQVIAAVKVVRDMLALDDNSPTYFCFQVKASGRTRDGDVEIKFKLGENDWSGVVEGDNVAAVLEEYLRRIGWEKAHQYLALPKAESAVDA